MGGTVTKCQKPAEPVRGGAAERFPLVRRGWHCTGNFTRHGNHWRVAQQHEVLSSPLPAGATPPAQTLFPLAVRNPADLSLKPNPCTGLGILSPNSGHAACDKDLGLTLGRFILNNLFAPVCRAGSQDRISRSWGQHTSVPAVGAASPTSSRGRREGFISIPSLG